MNEKKQNKFGFLQDNEGNNSSKRLFGALLIILGIIMAQILFYYSIVRPETPYETAKSLIEFIIASGSGLLGIGIAENFFGKK